jgi:hypothetical protein
MYDDIDPGTLGQVPGVAIAHGSNTLPTAGPDSALAVVEVDAGWAGRMRITYRAQRMRHGRSSHWAWVAVSAQKLE